MKSISADKDGSGGRRSIGTASERLGQFTGAGMIGTQRGKEDVHLEKWDGARKRRVLNASLMNLNLISH